MSECAALAASGAESMTSSARVEPLRIPRRSSGSATWPARRPAEPREPRRARRYLAPASALAGAGLLVWLIAGVGPARLVWSWVSARPIDRLCHQRLRRAAGHPGACDRRTERRDVGRRRAHIGDPVRLDPTAFAVPADFGLADSRGRRRAAVRRDRFGILVPPCARARTELPVAPVESRNAQAIARLDHLRRPTSRPRCDR